MLRHLLPHLPLVDILVDTQADPSARLDAVLLDDPPDQIGVGLLPEGFFALAEQVRESDSFCLSV